MVDHHVAAIASRARTRTRATAVDIRYSRTPTPTWADEVFGRGRGDWVPLDVPSPTAATTFEPGDPLALASIRFTSGSTGLPKGVMMSQAHMLASARMFCHLTDFSADDVLYSCFPVYHVLSSVTGILSTYPVPTGVEGEIVVRPRVPHVMMLGYFDDSDLAVERWRNLWFHTNDRGVLDADGYLYFKGRSGDRIRRRGVNVSAAEVEAAAARHRDVGEVAVIGVPASVGEDDIKLCVVLKKGARVSHVELRDHIARQLPRILVPRYIEVRVDFPRTQTEKIRKSALREEGERGLTPITWDAVTGDFIGDGARAAAKVVR